MLRTGSEEWWQTLQGPQCRAVDDAIEVTFWWRDPAGDETYSPRRRVWLYITGVTDHHQNARPQSLTRLPGTDAWSWRTTLSPTWRGSYCFIPSDRDDDFSPEVFSADAPDRALLREGWRKLLPRAIADPLNPHSWQGGRGHGMSALEMPQAPAQPGWDQFNEAHPPARCLEWRSARLGNHRRVWIYTPGEAVDPQTRPLAILLDGQFWAESMPVWSPLAALTNEGSLPSAVYLLIDAIDNQRRGVELPCHRDFWLAVQEELLPLIRGHAPFSDRPERTVLAGQSFGGLAAMFAALNWPQRFGCVLSQSGSYWWPHRDGCGTGFIGEQLRQGEVSAAGLRIWLEAGQREPIIFRANQALLAQLTTTQQTIFWRQVDGGHDALCWRGGLTAGLIQLWQPLLSHP
ncbi:TPA: enterochelin esterase [Klebsiella variicola]|uniref:enterochelin esterase n=1 Tax=Klebsiella variicola TaxID=244366 RepID=UPI000D74DE73|nr:enterochelin esterase [Klebsiella variicola]PXH63046.1 enterochelin esterase [Klebsiella variicola]HCC2476439.1 enterochelin esterase [Klebsiella variicola]HDK6089651.1 enterochelin esterase [Klebsiella variicola]